MECVLPDKFVAGGIMAKLSPKLEESASNLLSRLRKKGGLMRQVTCSGRLFSVYWQRA